ncbi:hypothetical protein D3C71_1682800 [compost metagenome]
MIRHCVAHPFGAAVGRSSQQAALLEPGEGSHPPSMGIRFAVPPDAKSPTIRSGFQFGGEGGMIRHCVAHPFGAASGRSSRQAALLEPGEGSHPPSMRIREHGSPDAKNRP